MLLRTVLFAFLLTAIQASAGQIVLKNGKKIDCDGPFEVKGKMVLYKQNGSLFQLPMKMVDLSKSSMDAEPEKKEEVREDYEVLIESKKPKKKVDIDLHNLVDQDIVSAPEDVTTISGNDLPRKLKSININKMNETEKEAMARLFIFAVKSGRAELVAQMMRKGYPFDGPIYDKLEQPIVISVQMGYENTAALLIKAGAQLDRYSISGKTPLIIALEKRTPRHKKIALMLLEAGANVNTLSRGLESPLSIAIDVHKKEMVAAILAKGADPNSLIGNGDYPIFRAIRSHSTDTLLVLLKGGANITLKNASGELPLAEAVKTNSISMVGILLEMGANPLKVNMLDQTPLDLALANHNVEMAKFLLMKYPDYPLKNLDKHLVSAVNTNEINLAAFLLEIGGKPNLKAENGDPLIIIAARRGHSDMVKLLLAKGANPMERGVDGVTAYVIADGKYKDKIRNMLKAAYNQK